jgi:hypothetical protein
MMQSEPLPCAGSAFSAPHSARLPAAYSIICPDGTVVYCCDTDCVEQVLHAQAGDVRRTVRGWSPLRKLAQVLGSG